MQKQKRKQRYLCSKNKLRKKSFLFEHDEKMGKESEEEKKRNKKIVMTSKDVKIEDIDQIAKRSVHFHIQVGSHTCTSRSNCMTSFLQLGLIFDLANYVMQVYVNFSLPS